MLGWVRRLLGGEAAAEEPAHDPDDEPESEPARRLNAAHRRLKQEIPPPEDSPP